MDLTGFNFIAFVAITSLLYFTVFRKHQQVILIAASVVFYLFSGPKYIVFILITSFVTWLTGLQIQKINDEGQIALSAGNLDKDQKKEIKKTYKNKARVYLIAAMIIIIGILAVLKYTDFFLQEVSFLTGISFGRTFAFVVPLGISYYTFMVVGYMLDVFWKRYSAEKSFFKIFLFTIYFPHITQGPIGRYDKLSPQFDEDHAFDYDRVTKGIQLMLWGLFEKLVIADRLAIFTNGVYAEWKTASSYAIIIAMIFFSIRLYMDFQGCMDIGRGVSQIFGIDLDLNFKRPYFSRGMQEFWQRWHITLGAWFKDYLLYPVSMSRLCKNINKWTKNKWGNVVSRVISTFIPTAVVWLITGIWHGAALRFLCWGIYHGCLIILSNVIEHPVERWKEAFHIDSETFSYRLLQMTRTFILSAIGRFFFFAQGIKEAFAIFSRLFDSNNYGLMTFLDKSLYQYGLNEQNYWLAWITIGMIWGIGMVQERGIVIRDWIANQGIIFRWIMYILLICAILIFGIYGVGFEASNFIYGGF